MKNKRRKELSDFHLIKGTSGVILDGIFVKNNGSELIIRSAFFSEKYLHFRPLKDNEKSL